MWARSYGRKSRALGDPETLDVAEVVAHQLAACDRMAVEDGVTLLPQHRLAEIGSGESLSERPVMESLLRDLERHPPPGGGRLYLSEVARLTRAEMEQAGRVARILREAKILVRVPGRCLNLADADDEAYFGWLCIGARQEVQRFKQRVAVKMQQQLAEGAVRLGAAPFGYVWNRNLKRLLPDGENFEKLCTACREVLHTSTVRLGKLLGVNQATLYNALTNPTICGWPSLHYRLHPKGDHRQVRGDAIIWCGKQNDTYPHACSRAQFERIQAVLRERWTNRGKTIAAGTWCRNLVEVEGYAGAFIRVSSTVRGSPNNRSQVPVYLIRENGRRLVWIERDRVHRAAEAEILRLLSDPEIVAEAMAAFWRHVEQQQAPGSGSAEAALQQTRQRYEDAVNAEFDAEEPLRSALRRRREKLEGELRLLMSRARQASLSERQIEELHEQMRHLPAVARHLQGQWAGLADHERAQVAGLCLRRVIVHCRRREADERRPGQLREREISRIVPQPWFER